MTLWIIYIIRMTYIIIENGLKLESRGVFRVVPNIYERGFLRKELISFSC